MKAHMNLSAAEKKAFNAEIGRQMQEWTEEHRFDMENIIFFVLHFFFGWGKKRCKRFFFYHQAIVNIMYHLYGEEINQVCDVPFLSSINLGPLGIKPEQWGYEMEHNTFKADGKDMDELWKQTTDILMTLKQFSYTHKM